MNCRSLISLFLICVCFTGVAHAFNSCSARKMWDAYNEMKRVQCKNCDRYFHCMGNYNAVYSCSGSMDDKKATAKQISDVREWAIFGGGADSAGDQEANLFGRNGGSCASRYLKNVRCAYNPATKQCKW
ncbi:serum amyloid A-5 protein-like [Daphnia pulex]|uniref:serum amyloid A-5 protein-like n=1 Tax=Daphnia pulex TaxID=6669 RepID=UPI001EDD13E9|nr:serum amyloid A-5 protein-like [Daphnia pulex]XP_046639857.1 serum amyloid A-5 protein-like [Daphnia pulicaria]